MKESTAEILRQLELELIRLDDFRWRLGKLSGDELAEVAATLAGTAEALSHKAHGLARLASLVPASRLPSPAPEAVEPRLSQG